MRMRTLLAGIIVGLVCGFSLPAGAHDPHAEVASLTELVYDQENLLNAYRCHYGIDVEAVKPGCTEGGLPAAQLSPPATPPAPEPTPEPDGSRSDVQLPAGTVSCPNHFILATWERSEPYLSRLDVRPYIPLSESDRADESHADTLIAAARLLDAVADRMFNLVAEHSSCVNAKTGECPTTTLDFAVSFRSYAESLPIGEQLLRVPDLRRRAVAEFNQCVEQYIAPY